MITASHELRSAIAAGRGEAAVERGEALRGDVLDVAAALGEGVDLARIGIEADHLVALLGEGHRQRQPHIPQPHDSDLHARQCRERGYLPLDFSLPWSCLSCPAGSGRAADQVVDVAGRRRPPSATSLEAVAVDRRQVADHRRGVDPDQRLEPVDVVGRDADGDRDRPCSSRSPTGQ